MFARKLKFKPKPTVGTAVRRAREKEELSEVASNEPDVSNKEITGLNKPLPSENENTSLHSATLLPNPATTKLETAIEIPILNVSNNNCSGLSHISADSKSVIVSAPNRISKNTNDFESCHKNSTNSLDSSVPDPKNNPESDSNMTNSYDIKLADVVPVVISSNIDGNINDCVTVNSNAVEEYSSTENRTRNIPANDSSASKIDSQSVIARFGRYRCKPVLSNLPNRKKNKVEDSNIMKEDLNVKKDSSNAEENVPKINSKVDNIDSSSSNFTGSVLMNTSPDKMSHLANPASDSSPKMITTNTNSSVVRKDSVIKSLKAEINKEKARALVEEIADSFSITEADETGEKMSVNKQGEDNIENPNENSIFTDVSGKTYSILIKPLSLNKMVRFADENRSMLTNLTSGSKNVTTPSNIEILNVHPVSSVSSAKIRTSPHKTSSKLVPKPSPRISDLNPRRISFQGSDMEDEPKCKMSKGNAIKKMLPKNRGKKKKDTKKNKRKRSHGSTYSQMGQDTLAKLSEKLGENNVPDKSKLTMIDLIFYNPKSNPMTVNSQTMPARKKEEKLEVNEHIEETLAEQSVDEVESTSMPVPQLTIGPDGQIMLDPKSLIIETTGTEMNRAKLENSEVIQETGPTHYRSYSKRKSSRTDWSTQETLQFYRALNTIGSDFALMSKLFPKRSRHDLKLKFKREEKTNMHLIDKAMTDPVEFDFKKLEEELKNENDELARKQEELQKRKEAIKEARAKVKEERLNDKSKPNKKKRVFSRAFQDFEENETEIEPEEIPLKRKRKRRVVSKKKSEEFIDSESDEVLEINSDSNGGSIDTSLDILKKVKETVCGTKVKKRSRKLMVYEEINETLKKKMEQESEIEEEVYTPNGLEPHNIYGASHEPEERQWDIEIQSLPTIDQTVIMDNIENVSELSELGSFGQNDSALNLSMPVRANIKQNLLRSENDNIFNGQIIAESIQIIDQLTANVACDNMHNNRQPHIKADILDTVLSQSEEEEEENKVILPSFESVSRTKVPMLYPMQSPYVVANSSKSERTFVDQESKQCEPYLQNSQFEPLKTHNTIDENVKHINRELCQDSENLDNSEVQVQAVNEPNIVLSNYYNENSTECILGD